MVTQVVSKRMQEAEGRVAVARGIIAHLMSVIDGTELPDEALNTYEAAVRQRARVEFAEQLTAQERLAGIVDRVDAALDAALALDNE